MRDRERKMDFWMTLHKPKYLSLSLSVFLSLSVSLYLSLSHHRPQAVGGSLEISYIWKSHNSWDLAWQPWQALGRPATTVSCVSSSVCVSSVYVRERRRAKDKEWQYTLLYVCICVLETLFMYAGKLWKLDPPEQGLLNFICGTKFGHRSCT